MTIRRGFCYYAGTTGDPTTSTGSTVYEDIAFVEGHFNLDIPGLVADTWYRIRAYVINGANTIYGNTVSVKTPKRSDSVKVKKYLVAGQFSAVPRQDSTDCWKNPFYRGD